MSDTSLITLATCEGACLIIPVQRHHVNAETMRRGCIVRLSLDPCESYVLTGVSNKLNSVSKNKLLFQVNLNTIRSYQASGTRNELHSIVMANGRKFQIQFDDRDEFDAFEPYLRRAIDSMNHKNKSDDSLVIQPSRVTSGNGNIGIVKTSGKSALNACVTQAPTYLRLLSSELSGEQNDSLEDDGYEKICEAKLCNQAPAISMRNAPPIPKRSGLKSDQQLERSDTSLNRRPLPALPSNITARNTSKLDAHEKPRLSNRSKSDDWSRDEEGYELPRQLNPSHRNIHKSDECLNDYTRLSNSFAASPLLSGSLQQLNLVLPHPRIVHLADQRLKTRSSEDLTSPKLAPSRDSKGRIQKVSQAQPKEYPKKLACTTKMKHAESHGDLSTQSTAYEPMLCRPVRDARSVTPPLSYTSLSSPRPTRCKGPPIPSHRRGVNISNNPLFHSESTLATSCPDGLNRIETRTHKFWSTNPSVREALSSMSFAPVASSLPNLPRDVLSPVYPNACKETSSVTSFEESSQRHRIVVLQLRKHVKQTVVNSKLGTYGVSIDAS